MAQSTGVGRSRVWLFGGISDSVAAKRERENQDFYVSPEWYSSGDRCWPERKKTKGKREGSLRLVVARLMMVFGMAVVWFFAGTDEVSAASGFWWFVGWIGCVVGRSRTGCC
ncbi:hypothetical protein HAX54_037199 [Datura stramonium]|uniref:Transmembrane protein n=1 Tax=Datura stramonium TaxID=4076 RepID=A0ABS8VL19_DATST|nr:hypothetical protein [Datura stramonium]